MTTYTFASWDRAGAAASLADPDDLVRTTPVRGSLAATASVNGRPARAVPVPSMQLYGPGDVRAIDPKEIVRLFPLPGTPDAETTRFPMVEFERSELPWLFTPLAPGPAGALRPWLALVCVPFAVGRPQHEPGVPLPVLRVAGSELPDPATLHLWAHAQTLPGYETDPRRSVSRLLTPVGWFRTPVTPPVWCPPSTRAGWPGSAGTPPARASLPPGPRANGPNCRSTSPGCSPPARAATLSRWPTGCGPARCRRAPAADRSM